VDSYQHFSLTLEQIAAFKKSVTGDAAFSDRVSVGFAYRLAYLKSEFGDDHHVIFEIDHMERGVRTSTKPATLFKHRPLKGFWHKHFTSHRHMLRNIGERWNIARGPGNHDLDRMIGEVATEAGNDPDVWPKLLVYRFVMGALEERAAEQRSTGDWIIFAKHEGQNYYLDLAGHEEGEEGENARRLFERIKASSAAEFPFLFKDE
jgi:hypothetical protein